MRPSRPIIHHLLLGLLMAALCVAFGASTASAQAETKRSAGTMKRSAGVRKGNDLGSQTQGRSSGMSSSRGSTRSAPRLPSEDDYKYEKKKSSYYDSASSDYDDDDDEEVEADSAPTLGRACIYGPGDKVLYRPAGSWCRGDDPAQFEQPQGAPEEASSGSPMAARQAPPAAPSSAYGYPEVRRKKKVKRLTSAGCLYGKDGEILYAPETSDCVNGIGAPQRP
jgi:hypothetical protein